MKKIFTLLVVSILCSGLSAQVTLQTFYDFSWPDINGDTMSMAQFAGEKVMVVNCASYCVFTPQYTPLKDLQTEYGRFRFTVIGYPCNDFNNQGGTDSAIIATCHGYQVNFPIMSPVSIVRGDTAPLYKWLQREDLNGVSNATVNWNFNKFLIDRQGHWVRWMTSTVDPLDTSITNWIVEDSATVLTGVQTIQNGEFVTVRSSNPTSTNITLDLNTNAAQQVDVNLYSTDGKPVGAIFTGTMQGNQQINYSVASLASGLYLLKAQSAGNQKTLKILVAH
jgi:glutathione peroxidase